MSGRSKITIDHNEIRRWIEQRGGNPSTVKATENGHPGILRVEYQGHSGAERLEQIGWEEFFEAFDKNHLAFLYQDDVESRFSKFIDRQSAKLTNA
jgi:hypothetical protein